MKKSPLILSTTLALNSTALAVDPPPGGGYPGGNTALGDNALFSQPNGLAADSTAIGFQALYHNILGGDENTAVGSNCLFNNTTGGRNTGIGFWALYSNTTGDGNTAVGDFILVNNTSGYDNVALGKRL